MKHRGKMAVAALAAVLAGTSGAVVTPEEAKQLGGVLTPWGAEKAGNKDGTIPAYTGPVAPPAAYDTKNPGKRPDPYAGEKPLFTIDAKNMSQYADKLSEGVREMMKKYPTFRIEVYPTHRTADYPKYVLDNTMKNATECKTVNNGLQLQGCYGGYPFPIPKNGNEVMWNHLARYEAYSWAATFQNWFVDASGNVVLQSRMDTYQKSPFYDPDHKGPVSGDVLYWVLLADYVAPPRKAGEKLLMHDPVDMVGLGRRVWQYLPGQRRVKLAPDFMYDTPNPNTGGTSTLDESQLFHGPQDRYDFKLLGKREMYIPYNNFKTADGKLCPSTVRLKKNHQEPGCLRWELHRVWEVEGTLKTGFRHVAPKRKFYFDEDNPGAGTADSYDASGKLTRAGWTIVYPMYEAHTMSTDMGVVHDLLSGAYSEIGDVAETDGWHIVTPKSSRAYTSEAMAAEGVR